MRYTLMHKDRETARIEFGEYGNIIGKTKVLDLGEMPVGTVRGGYFDPYGLDSWWRHRSVSQFRVGKGDRTIRPWQGPRLAIESLGLNLDDQYWIRPEGSDQSWEDLNFFDHPFSEEMGLILLGRREITDDTDFMSPDLATEGDLGKRWIVRDSRRSLLKRGGMYGREPFNEVIAWKIAESLDIPCVEYGLVWEDGEPMSVCDNFLTRDTELVSAHKVILRFGEGDGYGYGTYVKDCAKLGIDVVHSLDRMLVLDYIIGNFDRHYNNFGLIRDADTLEWIGPAPLFDSGSCLLSCFPEVPGWDVKDRCKPFKDSFREQVRLVGSTDWIDLKALEESIESARDVMESSKGIISEEWTDVCMDLIHGRLEEVKGLMKNV